jgi:hypothetical protein
VLHLFLLRLFDVETGRSWVDSTNSIRVDPFGGGV